MAFPPAIEIEDLGFAYGVVPALEDIALRSGRGEFLGLVGPKAGQYCSTIW